MSNATEARGPCVHDWLNFVLYAAGALDDESEDRSVEAQVAACETCAIELDVVIKISALLPAALNLARQRQRCCRGWWPHRDCR